VLSDEIAEKNCRTVGCFFGIQSNIFEDLKAILDEEDPLTVCKIINMIESL
jgi:predicted transcriptional regulator